MKMSQNGGLLLMGIKVDATFCGGNNIQQKSEVPKRNVLQDENMNKQPCRQIHTWMWMKNIVELMRKESYKKMKPIIIQKSVQ
jgi:hypothetical protein